MAYDLMNRRDNATNHHTSVAGAKEAIENYLAIGAPADKINLGFALYAKYFTTASDCGSQPLGCPIIPAEDPITGKDALTSGAWTYERAHMVPFDPTAIALSTDGTCGAEKMAKCTAACCSQYGNCGSTPEHCSGACQHAFGTGCTDPDVAGSWQVAKQHGVADDEAGGTYYFDAANSLFWTWDSPEFITRKFSDIVGTYKLGGVMAWSLGEDSYDWSHIKQIAAELQKGGYGGASAASMEQTSYDVVNVDGSAGEDADAEGTTAAASSDPTEQQPDEYPEEEITVLKQQKAEDNQDDNVWVEYDDRTSWWKE